jgi:hypothetical protein
MTDATADTRDLGRNVAWDESSREVLISLTAWDTYIQMSRLFIDVYAASIAEQTAHP